MNITPYNKLDLSHGELVSVFNTITDDDRDRIVLDMMHLLARGDLFQRSTAGVTNPILWSVEQVYDKMVAGAAVKEAPAYINLYSTTNDDGGVIALTFNDADEAFRTAEPNTITVAIVDGVPHIHAYFGSYGEMVGPQ